MRELQPASQTQEQKLFGEWLDAKFETWARQKREAGAEILEKGKDKFMQLRKFTEK